MISLTTVLRILPTAFLRSTKDVKNSCFLTSDDELFAENCSSDRFFVFFAVLESWLDYTGELQPPEPLARLPQLKHCIKQLITDLGKVQQIALCCST